MIPRTLEKHLGSFGQQEARHLLCRSGFGATPNEIRDSANIGLDATIELVFNRQETDSDKAKKWKRLRLLSQRIAIRGELSNLQASWFLTAVASPMPLREKIAIFWHDHFATSNTKVDDLVAMEAQMSIFMDHGLGSFRKLLGLVAKDPAMLVFLDGAQNNKANPNENFAREVFELFTLGIGNYTEQDIKNAARAFTGWQISRRQFKFDAAAHDQSDKMILGRRGKLGGEDVLDLCLAQDTCAEFISRKLAYFFLGTLPGSKGLKDLATCLRNHRFDLASFLKEFLSSALFFEDRFRTGRIKSPVEFALGILRGLDAKFSATRLAKHSQGMGQEVYNPPGVAGWPNGRAWINSTTIVARHKFVNEIALGNEGPLKFRSNLSASTTPEELGFALLGLMSIKGIKADDVGRMAASFLRQPQAQLG